ncbi:MAG: cytochrome c, class I [Magnetococcales bacterium]|nr:cytochrome c, class I [Magnetococcales bacterium]
MKRLSLIALALLVAVLGAGIFVDASAQQQAPAKAADAKPADKPADKPAAKPADAKPADPAPAKPAAAANPFNRLMIPKADRNPPPIKDGIHDPESPGTPMLQPPLDAFGGMPKSNAGNNINWVQAIKDKTINPRYDRLNPKEEPMILDLDIVREVKGFMPDVVYPHDRHTEWLDCSNCHPDIFIPQKGQNTISMAQILMGQKCGVCHGKVAFPVSECRLCHSKKKDQPKAASVSAPAAK